MSSSNGKASITMNSSTSHGELRNSWVMNQDVRAIIFECEIWPRPSSAPSAVPITIAKNEISTLNRKPCTLGNR